MLAIDLTLLPPENLITAELRFHGYRVGPPPDFAILFPEDWIPCDTDAETLKTVAEIDRAHREAAWKRFLARRNNGGAHG